MKTLICLYLMVTSVAAMAQSLTGAWSAMSGDEEVVLIMAAEHFSLATYNTKTKSFASTEGGSWKVKGKELILQDEFNTAAPERIGQPQVWNVDERKTMLELSNSEKKFALQRLDDGTPGALAGAWLITGRMTDNGMQSITPGARKTMKILSGTRFQWIAYNSATKEFFGTGGGTYTTENGKYTETIEFFSRDNTRVGMNLSFEFSLPEGNWRHQGKSSKGDPIDEVWTLREKLKL